MKVVAFNVREDEKEVLARANDKVHNLTLISNCLNYNTSHFAKGKKAVIVSAQDVVDKGMLDLLFDSGVRIIITRSVELNHIDCEYAELKNLHVSNVDDANASVASTAKAVLSILNDFEKSDDFELMCCCGLSCSKKLEIQ